MPRKPNIVTRRLNQFYVYTGPSWLLRPANVAELEKAANEMAVNRHVNRTIVVEELRRREAGTDTPMSVLELQYLRWSSYKEPMEEFIRGKGCSRRYAYVPRAPRHLGTYEGESSMHYLNIRTSRAACGNGKASMTTEDVASTTCNRCQHTMPYFMALSGKTYDEAMAAVNATGSVTKAIEQWRAQPVA